jgi:glutamate/tyrosine decarboxylase-like PLP-dependent enzyme
MSVRKITPDLFFCIFCYRIIPESAHSAYDKAAQYFQIKLRRAPVAADLRADVKAMKRLINKNTIMVTVSLGLRPYACFLKVC